MQMEEKRAIEEEAKRIRKEQEMRDEIKFQEELEREKQM